jgi:hypothetical protein
MLNNIWKKTDRAALYHQHYLIYIIKQWNEKYTTGIKILNDTKFNTILFADDQAVIANSEDYMLYTKQYKYSVWKSHIKNQNHGF